MVAPAAVVALGWTLEEIGTAVGIAGTVGGAVKDAASGASALGGTGWRYDGPDGTVLYPQEVGAELFLDPGQHLGGTLIRFFADGYLWNNECFVRYHGLFSHTHEPMVCYANGDHPLVPANRYLEVGFTAGGEELDRGLLTCGLTVYRHMYGSADEPYLALHAAGHFDPVGLGDAEYAFTLYLSTHGTVHLGDVEVATDGVSISEAGNQIDVKLDQ